MSARRQARARASHSHGSQRAFPDLLASRTHAGWDDADRVVADLRQLMKPADQHRLSLYPRSLYSVLLGRWAAANGFSRDGRPDWRELRAAGLTNWKGRDDR